MLMRKLKIALIICASSLIVIQSFRLFMSGLNRHEQMGAILTIIAMVFTILALVYGNRERNQ